MQGWNRAELAVEMDLKNADYGEKDDTGAASPVNRWTGAVRDMQVREWMMKKLMAMMRMNTVALTLSNLAPLDFRHKGRNFSCREG